MFDYEIFSIAILSLCLFTALRGARFAFGLVLKKLPLFVSRNTAERLNVGYEAGGH